MTTVVSIDPSSRKLAVVVTPRPRKFTVAVKKLSENHVLGSGQAFSFVDDLLRKVLRSDDNVVVYLERPVMGRGGAHSTIVQSQISGAVMAAASRLGVPVTMVNNQSWKKRICGRGNIDKAEVAARMATIWPELVAEAGKDQDLIDAGAINLFGWHALTLRKRIRRTR